MNNNVKILRWSLPISKSAAKQQLHECLKKETAKLFRQSARANRMTRIDLLMPATKFPREIIPYERRHMSILTQLRTSHVPLQSYLSCFKIEPAPICPQCQTEPESITHFLKHCTAYARPREKLQWAAGRLVDLDTSILEDAKLQNPLLCYIHDTNRFQKTNGNLRPPARPG